MLLYLTAPQTALLAEEAAELFLQLRVPPSRDPALYYEGEPCRGGVRESAELIEAVLDGPERAFDRAVPLRRYRGEIPVYLMHESGQLGAPPAHDLQRLDERHILVLVRQAHLAYGAPSQERFDLKREVLRIGEHDPKGPVPYLPREYLV